ncbi:peptidyl-prolyl cis-trans isomerase FKBP19, chloroplastic isoform X2 [Malania oleifera]|uniref:peptidyl-prolyl cis-trans isomerase FKBP19, chloroplastic isoform X2 n=1 Tax=Malania oleifera TaxID=397392 RepID=UPI0025AEAE73|nr:peptidyl-prolyl cis-trans isomerase FKBP19, chloroplastic isoform X2 [Malania oleifera]
MASISCIGSPRQCLALPCGGKASQARRHAQMKPISFREADEFPTSNVSSLCESCAVGGGQVFQRRDLLISSIGFLAGAGSASKAGVAVASEFADMPALRGKDYGKSKMRYPDYVETGSGLQYKDLRVGNGAIPKMGETVVVNWDGYTIGYYGRIFEARNKTKGGSFEVIPAFEEAVSSMALGGIRRIIVPPELGYPENDFNKMGPRPTTFSGQRALDFVLRNQGLIDKTLLFDIELLKILP